MTGLKVLIIGSGGREHALCWKISQSPLVDKIYVAKGNAGTSFIAENVNIDSNDIQTLIKFAFEKKIDLTVVGPEAPLVEGIVDQFSKTGLKCFGPSKNASQLEGSKIFCREFLSKANVPMPTFWSFTTVQKAIDFVKKENKSFVIKADGLAAGKGVFICKTVEEQIKAINEIMVQKKFGGAGDKLLIEEMLKGEEASYIVFSDGTNFMPMVSSQDHKRAFDNDKGPNTGGMGAYSPAPIVTKDVEQKIVQKIIQPTIDSMKEAGNKFVGILYAGLMIENNEPKLLEYNVRLGDPETQAILPRMESDLIPLILACLEGDLRGVEMKWSPNACTTIVLASGGYPEKYEKEKTIKGLDDISSSENTIVFHAGTKRDNEKVLTFGGRVLAVSALGKTIQDSINNAYSGVKKISFDKMFYRKDIGQKALKELDENNLKK